jgi:tetratricopeptide (TPR) repeat protein
MPPGSTDWKSMAALELFVAERRKAIAEAVRGKREWAAWSRAFEGTGAWLTDVHAGYSVLARHPLGTDAHVVAHYDFLKLLSAAGQASRVLDEGLRRFPDSWALHDRLRGRILRERGIDGLEEVYASMIREKDAAPNLDWYAGYASLVAAEFHRRRGRDAQAIEAYDRAIARYDRWIDSNPGDRGTADHYIALGLAGKARLAYEAGDDEETVALILASFKRRPDAAATLDGLNISPVDTAKMLLQRLKDSDEDDLAARLETAMGELDPELLKLPAYEREGPSRPMRNRGRRPRRNR